MLRAEAFGLRSERRTLSDGRDARRAVSVRRALGSVGGRCSIGVIVTASAACDGYAEDYASTTFGLLELFQADGDVRWLAWADALQEALDRALLGRGERRMVQHDGRRSDRAAAAEGRLRRRRAVRRCAGAPEPADADAPPAGCRRGRRESSGRSRAIGADLGDVARAVPLVAAALSTWHAGIGQTVIVGRSGVGGLRGAAACAGVALSAVLDRGCRGPERGRREIG